MNAMLGLVAAGEGLTFIPELIFDRFPPCSEWSSRPLRLAKPAFALNAVWNSAHVSHTLSTYFSFFPEPDFGSKRSMHLARSAAAASELERFMPGDDQEKKSDQKQPTSEFPSQNDSLAARQQQCGSILGCPMLAIGSETCTQAQLVRETIDRILDQKPDALDGMIQCSCSPHLRPQLRRQLGTHPKSNQVAREWQQTYEAI